MILYRAMSWQELSKYLSDITIRPVPGLPSMNTLEEERTVFFRHGKQRSTLGSTRYA